MSPILIIAIVILLTYIIYDFATSKSLKNYPPGPLRLPFFGSYLQMLLLDYRFPHIAFDKMKKKYKSPILGTYFGDFKMIVANDYESCKEIFTRPELQGRNDGIISRTRAFGKQLGIFFDDGEKWLNQKRFSLRELRDFGFGRRSDSFERIVEEEVSDLLCGLRKSSEKGESVLLPDALYPIMINCIFQLLIGARVPPSEHEKLKELGQTLMRFQRSTDATGRMLTMFPFLHHVVPQTIGYTDCLETSKIIWRIIKDNIEEHKKTFDKEVARDYIDSYLGKMSESPDFDEDQLTMCCIDLILPQTAVATAVTFALMHVLQNPHVLEKCQNEMDSVVGTGRIVTLNDRQYLPYTEATVRELLRRTTIAPLGTFHRATEDTTYFGYDVPADTIMVTNIWSMHMDEKLWGDPENFRPERFLDHKGNLKKKDLSMAFGLGKRVCAGETFVRQNIFITMANIFHNFNPREVTPVDFNEIHEGLINNPPDNFYIKLESRY